MSRDWDVIQQVGELLQDGARSMPTCECGHELRAHWDDGACMGRDVDHPDHDCECEKFEEASDVECC